MKKHFLLSIMKKYLISAVLVVAAVIIIGNGTVASAQTTGNSVSDCVALMKYMRRGLSNDWNTGNEVTRLQRFLVDQGFMHPMYIEATGTNSIGPKTEAAIKAFQSANGIDPTGTVGPITRAKINARICVSGAFASYMEVPVPTRALTEGSNILYRFKVTAGNKDYTINNETFYLRQKGTLIDHLKFSIFADTSFTTAGREVTLPDKDYSGTEALQTIQVNFEPLVIPKGETRYIELKAFIATKKDVASITTGHKGLDDVMLSSGISTSSAITVLSPNGGDRFQPGQQVTIKYNVNNFPRPVKVQFQLNKGAVYPSGPYHPINGSGDYQPATGTYVYTLPTGLADGTDYSFLILTDYPSTESPSGNGHSANFSIISGTSTQSGLTVLSPNGGETMQRGQPFTIRWSASPSIKKVGIYITVGCATQVGCSNQGYVIALNAPNTGMYQWNAGAVLDGFTLPDGSYKIHINDVTYDNSTAVDMTDNPFTIVTPTSSYPGFSISLDKTSYLQGETAKVTLSRSDGKTDSYPVDVYVTGTDPITRKMYEQQIRSGFPVTQGTQLLVAFNEYWAFGKDNGDYTVLVCAAGANCMVDGTSINNNRNSVGFTVSKGSVLPLPSCTLYTLKQSYVLGETITFNWTSRNALYASWQQDTSGKDHLNLPGDKLSAGGSQNVVANVIGYPTVTLNVTNNTGSGSCTKTINVTSASPTTSTQSVTSFSLINADTGQVVPGYETIFNASTLNLAKLPTTHLNIRANTSPAQVGSVKFSLSGAETTSVTESVYPYALKGNDAVNASIYLSWTPTIGSYALVATPYTGNGTTGTVGTSATITFRVINDATVSIAPEPVQTASLIQALQALINELQNSLTQ
jgi:hypothetical protein